MRRFLGKFLLCPTHPQKPPIPATLHATLRINKILYNPRRYEEAEPEVEVFGQALNSGFDMTQERRKDIYDLPKSPTGRISMNPLSQPIIIVMASFAFWLALGAKVLDSAEPNQLEVKGTYIHPYYSMGFPEEVSQFRRINITQFDTHGYDLGVDYVLLALGAEVHISVYVYPVKDSQGSPDDVVERHFVQVKSELTRVHPGARMISEGEASLSLAPDAAGKGKRAVFSYEGVRLKRRQQLRSELCLFLRGPWFVKYRMTYPETQSDAVELHIKSYMNAVPAR